MVKAKQLTLELNLDDKATKELLDFAKQLEVAGKKGKKTGKDIERGFKRGSKAVKGLTQGTRNATRGMGGMIVKIAALTGAFRLLQSASRKGFSFIDQASRFEEEIAKFGVVFGQEAERVAESLDEMSGAMNRSRGELVAFASSFQDIFVPLGFARKEASDLSLKLTELAIDVGSFNNRLDTDVIRDFQSALVGSSITVRKYGILIDQARINQVGWALGLAKQGDELTAQQRVIARYNILLQDSADAVGDAVRTADSFANTMKGLSAQISDTGIAFGQELQVAVLETIKSMGGIEGVIEVVRVGFAAITSGTEFLIRTLGRFGGTMREFIAALGGANNAVALIRGEMDGMGESTGAFARAWAEVPKIVKEAGIAAVTIAGIVGEEIANALAMGFGSSVDKILTRGVLAKKINSLAAATLPGGKFRMPVSLFADITQEDAALLADDLQSALSSRQIALGFSGDLAGTDLKEAHARVALSVGGLNKLLKSGLDVDTFIGTLSEIDPALFKFGDGLIKFSKEAELGVDKVNEISELLAASFDPGKVQKVIRENIDRVRVTDIDLAALTHFVGAGDVQERAAAAIAPVISSVTSMLEGIGDTIEEAGVVAKDRSSIRIADFINTDTEADQATVREVAHRFVSILGKVGAAMNKGAKSSQLAPAFAEQMGEVLRESEKFGVLIPQAAFDTLIATAKDLGVSQEVIREFRVLGAGIVQETKDIADKVTDAGGQIKINFGLIGKEASRGLLEGLADIGGGSGDLHVTLQGFADQAEELGIKVPPSILGPLTRALSKTDLGGAFQPTLDRLVAVSDAAGRRSGEALGARLVATLAQDRVDFIEAFIGDLGLPPGAADELTKPFVDRVQLALGRLESLGIEFGTLGKEFVERFGAGLAETAPLEGASATILEKLKAELSTLKSELAAGIGGVTGAEVIQAQLAVSTQAISDDTTATEDQKTRQIAALNEGLKIQRGLQENLNAARLAGLNIPLGALYQREIAGINATADAAILAAEALVTQAKISVDAKNVEVEAINAVRDAQIRLAEDYALDDSLERAASLAAELGTAFDLQRREAIRAARAAETLAIASAGTSDLAKKNLEIELELLRQKLALSLKHIGIQERGAKGAAIWGELLGDQEAGLKLQTELAGAFDSAIGGLARSFVDASSSWADFRDQFLMSIAQMIVKALLLASIQAVIKAFSYGTFASGGVVEGVGSGATGAAPGFAMGGVMDGVMGGVLPVHQYAGGGIARTPQLAVFGEGRGAEAFVPLPDGKSIPVKMDGSSGPISVNLTVASLDPRTAADVVLAQMPKIRKELASALREGTDRSLTEGVRGAARR